MGIKQAVQTVQTYGWIHRSLEERDVSLQTHKLICVDSQPHFLQKLAISTMLLGTKVRELREDRLHTIIHEEHP